MLATVFPWGSVVVLVVVLAIAEQEDVRAKRRRARDQHADDHSLDAFDAWREALR